jgi:multiple sugar transport system permease protein
MNQRIFFTEIGSKIWKLVRFIILLGLSYVLLYPILYMLTMAVRPLDQVMDPSVIWIPKAYTTSNFEAAINGMSYWKSMGTTLIVSLVSSVLSLVSCSMVGYGFARFKFKSSGLWFTFVLLTLIVPAQAITIPMYLQYQEFSIPIISPILKFVFGISMPDFMTVNMIDSWFVFWAPAVLGVGIRAGLYIYIFRQFFRNIPTELEEAAVVDGAGYFKTFYRIMVPNAGGAYLTVFLFSVVWYWNDTFNSNIFMSRKKTLAKALSGLRSALGGGNNEYDLGPKVQAGCLLFIAPLLLMYIFLQKYFVQSVERTGIVG